MIDRNPKRKNGIDVLLEILDDDLSEYCAHHEAALEREEENPHKREILHELDLNIAPSKKQRAPFKGYLKNALTYQTSFLASITLDKSLKNLSPPLHQSCHFIYKVIVGHTNTS